MIGFAYNREQLGPVLDAFDHTLCLPMRPLAGNANRTSLNLTQPTSSTRTYNHHNQPPELGPYTL